MADRQSLGAGTIEVLPGRLYWTTLHVMPRSAPTTHHYFSIDSKLVYQPFNHDFGPLSLSSVYRYCKILHAKLGDPSLAGHRIIHYCSQDPKKRANAAFLICAYQVIALRQRAEVAFAPFEECYPPFLPFRDAISGHCTYQCTILDCLAGLEKGIELGWFDWTKFDVESAEFFESVENGDMNWIIPNRFLAFAGPHPTSRDADGYPAFTPEDYVPIFRDAGIGLVVRLNKPQYERHRFINHGVKHVDLFFVDGSCPSQDIIAKFLHIVEQEPSAVAVHCKAGLGRTGSLIGLYAMKHHGFPARAWTGWNRLCRPGSILGPQQQFLVDMQNEMFQAGAAVRRQGIGLSNGEADLHRQFEMLSLRERTQAETVEDTGQGERLCAAKRVVCSPSNGNGSSGGMMRGLRGMFGGRGNGS